MKNPLSAMRRLIARHRDALDRLGEVVSIVEKTSAKGGRPGRTYWLNKRQCLYLCIKSETERATEATIQMVEVFDAYRNGTLPPPKPVEVKGHSRARPKPGGDMAALMPIPTRDGVGVLRVGNDLVTIDTQQMPIGGGRSVVFDFPGKISIT